MRTSLIIACVCLLSAASLGAPKSTCDLITQQEVESIMGVPMRPPEKQIFNNCEYKSVGDHPYKSLHLLTEQVSSRDEWNINERKIDPDVKPLVVPGIGDGALLWNRVLDARLSVLKGKTAVSIMFDVGKMMPKTQDTLPVAKRIADIVVPRLP